MMDLDGMFYWFGLVVVAAPCGLVAVLGFSALVNLPLSETTISRLTQSAVLMSLLPAIGILLLMIATGRRYVH